jgi:hypothetical protein
VIYDQPHQTNDARDAATRALHQSDARHRAIDHWVAQRNTGTALDADVITLYDGFASFEALLVKGDREIMMSK